MMPSSTSITLSCFFSKIFFSALTITKTSSFIFPFCLVLLTTTLTNILRVLLIGVDAYIYAYICIHLSIPLYAFQVIVFRIQHNTLLPFLIFDSLGLSLSLACLCQLPILLLINFFLALYSGVE